MEIHVAKIVYTKMIDAIVHRIAHVTNMKKYKWQLNRHGKNLETPGCSGGLI